jgi:hypothetical protein
MARSRFAATASADARADAALAGEEAVAHAGQVVEGAGGQHRGGV